MAARSRRRGGAEVEVEADEGRVVARRLTGMRVVVRERRERWVAWCCAKEGERALASASVYDWPHERGAGDAYSEVVKVELAFGERVRRLCGVGCEAPSQIKLGPANAKTRRCQLD